MTTLEKIRAEIEKHTDGNNHCDEYLDGYNNGMKDALEIIDKYAEQEPNSDIRLNRVKNELSQVKNELEPQESDEISDRNMKMWEAIFKAESEDKGVSERGLTQAEIEHYNKLAEHYNQRRDKSKCES